jgi:Protein of unknown function (DUF2523)
MGAVLINAFVGAIGLAMASFVGRAILAAGIGFVTYTGITVAVGVFKSQVISSIGGLPAEVSSFLGFLWVDKGLTLIFSSIGASMAITAVGGSVKKAVIK